MNHAGAREENPFALGTLAIGRGSAQLPLWVEDSVGSLNAAYETKRGLSEVEPSHVINRTRTHSQRAAPQAPQPAKDFKTTSRSRLGSRSPVWALHLPTAKIVGVVRTVGVVS
jgi:hypothetical protein